MYPHFENDNIIYYQYGRANNWALGYNDTVSFKKKTEKFSNPNNKKFIKIEKNMDF